MTKHVWKLKDYGSGWSASEISDDMNKLASDGWEVHQSMSIPDRYEISIFDNSVSGFNDGDSISMTSTMRLLFRK
jgi:hypothetical protein